MVHRLRSSYANNAAPYCQRTLGIWSSLNRVRQTRSSSANTLSLARAYRFRTLAPSLQQLAREERCARASSSTAADKRVALIRRVMMTGGWTSTSCCLEPRDWTICCCCVRPTSSSSQKVHRSRCGHNWLNLRRARRPAERKRQRLQGS